MRILFIAMQTSIHTVRWINQIKDKKWEIFLYPSININKVHTDFRDITVFHPILGKMENSKKTVIGFIKSRINKYVLRPLTKSIYNLVIKDKSVYTSKRIARIIKKVKPDIIHSLETQLAGYMTLDVKKVYKGEFPVWIHTNWGSDIYLFGRLNEHKQKIKDVLANCDYYSCECHRDIVIARKFGFKGKILPVFPNTGGFDLDNIYKLRSNGKTSQRRLIMLKGYQGWAGRCLVGLRALERCIDILRDYVIIIYLACTEEVRIKAELISEFSGIEFRIISESISHEEMLKLHGQARISIGLNISDAISTSLLEAMAMGSFPIQSWTSCADEWIEDGKTGILVPPEDPEEIEKAIRRAIEDDELVDEAAVKNWELTKEKLDVNKLKSKAIEIYETVNQMRT